MFGDFSSSDDSSDDSEVTAAREARRVIRRERDRKNMEFRRSLRPLPQSFFAFSPTPFARPNTGFSVAQNPERRSIPLTDHMINRLFHMFSKHDKMDRNEFYTFINNIFKGYTHTTYVRFPLSLSRFAEIINNINFDRNDPDIFTNIADYIINNDVIGRGGRKNLRGINVLFSKKQKKSLKRMGKTKRLRKYNKKSTYKRM